MSFLDAFGAYDDFVRTALILMLVALSMYLLLNAGLFAVPQIGFMAMGSYVAGVVAGHAQASLWLTLPLAALAAAVAGLILGVVLARLNGIYLAVATLAFGEIVRVTALNLGITGGAQGLLDVSPPVSDTLICAVTVVVVLGLLVLSRSSLGRVIRGIREDPLMTAHQGVNVGAYRVALFVAAGALAGLAGGLFAHYNGFVVSSTYSFHLLTTLLAATVVGGMTNALGPVIGTILVLGLPQVLTSVSEYTDMIYAAVIILVMTFLPGGLMSGVAMAGRWLRRALGRDASPASDELEPVLPTRPPEAAEVSGGPLLEVTELAKAFGGVRAVQDVSLSIEPGQVLGLIGPNGSGKTTMLNLLSGVYPPAAGSGVLAGSSLAPLFGHPHRLARAGISRTFQGIRLLPHETVLDNVRLGAGRSIRRHGGEDSVRRVLAALALEPYAQSTTGGLPYGVQRRVEIARALVRRPSLLLLDEPTAGMTPVERQQIFQLARDIAAQGVSVVVVEHDVESITTHCDQLAVLDFGRLIAFGRALDVVREEAVINAYFGAKAHA